MNSKKYKFSIYNILIESNKESVIIYNTYTGGIIRLDREIYEYCNNNIFEEGSIKYFKELFDNGYIVNCKINEYQKVKTFIEYSINDAEISTVSYVIAPTLKCNLNCVYCFQKDYRKNNIDYVLTDKTLNDICNFIIKKNKDNTKLKEVKITWFGGEPLLCYDKILSLGLKLKIALEKFNVKLETAMITNGVLINENKLKNLIEKVNLTHIQITLDGEVDTYCSKKQTTKDVFYKVLDNISLSTKYIRTNVRVNADKGNFEELQCLIKTLFDLPIDKDNLTVHFAQLRDYSKEKNSTCFNDLEYWEYKHKFYSELPCVDRKDKKDFLFGLSPVPYCGIAKRNNFVIDYEGNLYKCEHYIGDKTQIVGNVIDGVYFNDIYQKSIKLPTDVRCQTCNILPYCNYAQCSAMHVFAGNGNTCCCYDSQLEVIKKKVKRYLEICKNKND